MRQRADHAMAPPSPQVIIADEPTTALDVIVQDQILKELKRIQAELGMSIIYISHDIAVIAEVTDSMGVMYAGKLVEFGHNPRCVLPPDPSICLLAAPVHAVDHRATAEAGPAWRRAPRPAPPAYGLPIPSAVPVRYREVHGGRAAARGGASRAPGGLLALGRSANSRGGAAPMTAPETTSAGHTGEPAAPTGREPGEEVPPSPGGCSVPPPTSSTPWMGSASTLTSGRASGWWASRDAGRPPRGGCWSS